MVSLSCANDGTDAASTKRKASFLSIEFIAV
jgi:hypothetical protein